MSIFSNPAFQIAINGSAVEGLLHASIVSSNCFSSDSFSITFAMGRYPLSSITFWSTLSSAIIDVSVAAASNCIPQELVSGPIDMVHIDPINRVVSIEGRYLSSRLIDSYRQQDFVNQTASEVVSAIAVHHGLNPVVTATSANVGRYYGDGYTRLSLGQFSRLRSDWDVVVQLARENSFDVFVQGQSLFFRPSLSNATPVRISFGDLKSIRFEQALTGSSETTARIQSWNSQMMESYDSQLTSASATSQPFLFSEANFTAEQVTASSSRYSAELGRLGLVLQMEMPWLLQLSPRDLILIDETGTPLDAIYRIDSLERHYSTTAGSTQIVRAAIIDNPASETGADVTPGQT